MRLFLATGIVIILAGCNGEGYCNLGQTHGKSDTSCYNTPDSLIQWGMEPLAEIISQEPLTGIILAKKFVQFDSLKFEITLTNIPDSIIINNQNISFGYSEYGLEFVCRNQSDSVRMDNVVFALNYFRPGPETPEEIVSVDAYLDECDFSSYIEKTSIGQELTSRSIERLELPYDFYRLQDRLVLCIPVHAICNLMDTYFNGGFYVKTSYNNSSKAGMNNFNTGFLTSDGWVRHFYIFNSSRRLTEKPE